jgi:hypothetical protein
MTNAENVLRHLERGEPIKGKMATTKDTKTTKAEFGESLNLAIGCTIEVHPTLVQRRSYRLTNHERLEASGNTGIHHNPKRERGILRQNRPKRKNAIPHLRFGL